MYFPILVVTFIFLLSSNIISSPTTVLIHQVSSGATVADPQVMKAVCSTLQLVTAVLATLPTQLPALVHVVHEALVLLRRYMTFGRNSSRNLNILAFGLNYH